MDLIQNKHKEDQIRTSTQILPNYAVLFLKQQYAGNPHWNTSIIIDKEVGELLRDELNSLFPFEKKDHNDPISLYEISCILEKEGWTVERSDSRGLVISRDKNR